MLALAELGLGLAVSSRCDPMEARWLLGGALLMELAAVPLPSFGFFSLATPFYLALLVQPRLGLLPVLLVAPAAALIRALLGRHPLPTWLAQTVPLLTAGLTLLGLQKLQLSPPVAALFGVQVYALAAWQVPRLLAGEVLEGEELAFWSRVQARAVPLTGGVICAGLLAAVYEGPPWGWLLLCGLLLTVRTAFYAAVVRVEALEREALRSGLTRAERQRDQALEGEGKTRQELSVKLNQIVVLEELSRALATSPEPGHTMDLILKLAGATVACETLAIFLPEGSSLFPRRFRSPHAERLASGRLLGVTEPVVLQAWSSGEVQTTRGDAPGERLLPGETALAVPLGRLGVLYLGDARRPGFTAEEVQQLRTLAVQGTVCLQCADYFTRLQGSLHEYAQAHARLQTWSQGLDRVLESASRLHSTLEVGALEAHLRPALQAVIPHEHCWLVGAPEGPLGEVAQTVLASGKPLLFEDLQATRFTLPGVRSLLAVPFGARPGVIVLGAAEAGRFDRQAQDLLMVLAYQAGAAWQNAETHEKLARSFRLLQDSQAQLVQAGKMAAVGQLAAGVAHELNSPLGAIVLGVEGALDLLERRPERAKERLGSAWRSACRAQEIVAKLLFYAREGTQGSQAFDLNQVVEDSLSLVSHQLALDNVKIGRELGVLPSVEGNLSEIQQVIINLVLNARDAVLEPAAQAAEITLATRAEDGRVCLVVSDRGPGVPLEIQDRIFEPFFTTKPVGRGTGLGLSLSQQIVQQHGGELSVSSQPGQGAAFRLSLPEAAKQPLRMLE